jgi:hypothetical protein
MAATQALSKLQHSGGMLNKIPEKKVLCKAFKQAVKQWCDEKKAGQKHNGDFNDYFFRKLYGTPGGRLGDVGRMRGLREAVYMNPYGVSGAGAATAVMVPGAAGAPPVHLAMAAGGNASAFRGSVLGSWGSNWATGRPMFPDSVLGQTPVEIKGPNDTLSTKQAKKYQKIQGQGKLIVVSCQSCKASCSKTNKCKK